MSKLSLIVAAAALAFVGCDEGSPGIAGGEDIEVMASVSAMVTAPVGPGDREAEFVVEVRHDPALDPEAAARLLDNIRVVQIPEFDSTPDSELDQDRLWGGDVYWFDGQPFAVSVTVNAVDEELEDLQFRFEWIDVAELWEHCPDGSHPIF